VDRRSCCGPGWFFFLRHQVNKGLERLLNARELNARSIFDQEREADAIRTRSDITPKALETPAIPSWALAWWEKGSATSDEHAQHLPGSRGIKRFCQTLVREHTVAREDTVSSHTLERQARQHETLERITHW
jgi:hypothetical protein